MNFWKVLYKGFYTFLIIIGLIIGYTIISDVEHSAKGAAQFIWILNSIIVLLLGILNPVHKLIVPFALLFTLIGQTVYLRMYMSFWLVILFVYFGLIILVARSVKENSIKVNISFISFVISIFWFALMWGV